MSKERNTTLDASGNSFAPKLIDDHNSKIAVNFEENYLKQGKLSYIHRNIVNFRRLEDYLFCVVKLTKNIDPGKYSYSEYGIRFDSTLILIMSK